MEGCGARLSASVGLIVVAVGLVLTYVSYRDGATVQQDAIFIAVMVAGLIIMLASTMQPSITTRRGGRKSPVIDVASYVAPPGQMREGYCWQCGRRIRKKNHICAACGATQMNSAQAHEQLSTAPTMERRPATSFMTEADLPVPGAQSPSIGGITPRRSAPRYIPGASSHMPAIPPDPDVEREREPSGWRKPAKPPQIGLPIRNPAGRSARPTFRRRQPPAWNDADGEW
jgi:hypothetical protein